MPPDSSGDGKKLGADTLGCDDEEEGEEPVPSPATLPLSPEKYVTPERPQPSKRPRGKASVKTRITDSGGKIFITPETGRPVLRDTPACLRAVSSGQIVYIIHSSRQAMRMVIKRFNAIRFAGQTPTSLMSTWTTEDTAEFMLTVEGVLKHTALCGRDFYVGHTCSARRGRQHGRDIARSIFARAVRHRQANAPGAAASPSPSPSPSPSVLVPLAPASPSAKEGTKKAIFFAAKVEEGEHAYRQTVIENIRGKELGEFFEGLLMLITEAQEKGANTRGAERKAEVEAFYRRVLVTDVEKLRGQLRSQALAAAAAPIEETGEEEAEEEEEEEEEEEAGGGLLCDFGDYDDEGSDNEDGLPVKRVRFDFDDADADLVEATAVTISAISHTIIDGIAHPVTVINTAADGNCGFHALAAVGAPIKNRQEFIAAVLAKYRELIGKLKFGLLSTKERRILALIQKIFGSLSPEAWEIHYSNPVNWMNDDTLELFAFLTDLTIQVHAVAENSLFTPIQTFNAEAPATLHIANVHITPTTVATGALAGTHFTGLIVGVPQLEALAAGGEPEIDYEVGDHAHVGDFLAAAATMPPSPYPGLVDTFDAVPGLDLLTAGLVHASLGPVQASNHSAPEVSHAAAALPPFPATDPDEDVDPSLLLAPGFIPSTFSFPPSPW